jgi:hypothetical protein
MARVARYTFGARGEAYLASGQGNAAAAEFQKILSTAALSGTAGRERWRIWEWRVRMHSKREPRRVRKLTPPASGRSQLIRISSRSGRTPTRTFRFSSLRKPSTQS